MQQVHGCLRTTKIDLWTLHKKSGFVLMHVEELVALFHAVIL